MTLRSFVEIKRLLTVTSCVFHRHLRVCNWSCYHDRNHCSDHQHRYLCCSCDHMNRQGCPCSCARTNWLPHSCCSCAHMSRLIRPFRRHLRRLVNGAPPPHACSHLACWLSMMYNHVWSWRSRSHCHLNACWAQLNNRLLHFVWCQQRCIQHVCLSSPSASSWSSPPGHAWNLTMYCNHRVSCHKNWCCQENNKIK